MEQKKRQTAMRFVLAAIIAIILGAIILFLIPSQYDQSFTGISYRFDRLKKIDDVSIRLTGNFKRHFFKPDQFEGLLMINEEAFNDIQFSVDSSQYGYALHQLDNGILGKIYFSDVDKSFSIIIAEGEEKVDVKSSLIITTNVTNRMDAMVLLKAHMKNDF